MPANFTISEIFVFQRPFPETLQSLHRQFSLFIHHLNPFTRVLNDCHSFYKIIDCTVNDSELCEEIIFS